MEITKDILYVGVNDHNVDLFEGQYVVPNGMSYNSSAIGDNLATAWAAASPITLSCSIWSPTILPI